MEAMARQQPFHSGNRPVEKMFVIDRIKLALLDHVAKVWDLHPGESVILQQYCEALDEVVGDDDVGALAFRCQLPRQLRPKEGLQRRHTALGRGGGRSSGGVDAKE